MADDKDKPSVLENKDEFKKQEDKASPDSENANDLEEISHTVEKVEIPGSTGL